MSSKLIDKTYYVTITGNIFVGIICSVLMALLIAFVTEKFTVKKAKKYKIDEFIEEETLTKDGKKGLRYAVGFAILSILFFIYMLIPLGTPLSGLLLDYAETDFYGRIFSGNSYVIQGLAFMISVTLIICGWIYGRVAKTIKTKNDFSTYLYDSLNNIGSILVLFFFAAQLIALFKKTNLGLVFSIKAADLINSSGFAGIPLVLLFFILVLLVNIFQTSATIKWSVMAPIVVPISMKSNMSPEFAQLVFRAGDTVTNIITPFFPYFVVLIGMLQIYNKQEEAIGIRYTYKLLFPYLVATLIFWVVILICWYILNIHIGIGANPLL
jgi:aminobenzoyl-glutamate transport protein